jgi:hypothetical protein
LSYPTQSSQFVEPLDDLIGTGQMVGKLLDPALQFERCTQTIEALAFL